MPALSAAATALQRCQFLRDLTVFPSTITSTGSAHKVQGNQPGQQRLGDFLSDEFLMSMMQSLRAAEQ